MRMFSWKSTPPPAGQTAPLAATPNVSAVSPIASPASSPEPTPAQQAAQLALPFSSEYAALNTATGSAPSAPPATSPSVRPSVLRPTARFMLSHPAHLMALGFGSGLSRIAPGTAGTLWAWAAFVVMQLYLSPLQISWVIAASLPMGWWACTVCARNMRVMDPGSIVWDEVIAFWIILWMIAPASLWAQGAAFVLFRFFDAVKPGPVAWADSLFKGFGAKGGWGIIFDDLVAAACTLLVIALWRF